MRLKDVLQLGTWSGRGSVLDIPECFGYGDVLRLIAGVDYTTAIGHAVSLEVKIRNL